MSENDAASRRQRAEKWERDTYDQFPSRVDAHLAGASGEAARVAAKLRAAAERAQASCGEFLHSEEIARVLFCFADEIEEGR